MHQKSSCRKPCKECPWTNKSAHNTSMIESIIRWVKNGSRKTTEHRCHMISHDLWADSTPDNVCAGSITPGDKILTES